MTLGGRRGGSILRLEWKINCDARSTAAATAEAAVAAAIAGGNISSDFPVHSYRNHPSRMLCLYISIFLSPFLSLSLSLTLCLSLSLSLCLSLPLNHSLTLSCLSFSRSHLSLTLYYLSLCLSLCLSLVYISVSVILALRLSLPPTFDLFTDFSLFLNAYVHLCKSACTFSYSFVSMLIRLSYNLVRCSSVINMTKGSLVIIDNCSSSAYALF